MPHRKRRAVDLGPVLLESVRGDMIDAGLARTTINGQVGRIRRTLRWAVSRQLLRPDVLVAAASLAPLRAGRSEARETIRVGPVPDEHVEAVLPLLSPPLRAAAEVLRATGARTGEILAMRVGDLDVTADPWEYRPRSHKTEHRGKARLILLGPRARDVILPLLRADPEAFVFRPGESLSRRYHGQALRNAAIRACGRLNAARAAEGLPPFPVWRPHQLRHSAATRLRREFGVDVAKAALGHASIGMTEVYAERDLTMLRKAVKASG